MGAGTTPVDFFRLKGFWFSQRISLRARKSASSWRAKVRKP